MKISVVVPCYNYAEYVAEAIESIYRQKRLPDQVIVINDGSVDESDKVIKDLSKKYTFQYINQSNKGVIGVRNEAIELIDSDYNIFLDADDMMPKEYIATLEKEALADGEKWDILYTKAINPSTGEVILDPPQYKLSTLRLGNYIHSASMVKTSLLKDNKYDPTLTSVGFEDFELFLRLAMKGAKVKLVTGTHLLYRQHAGQGRDASVKDDFKSVQALEYVYFKMLGINPDSMNELRWVHGRLKIATDYAKNQDEKIAELERNQGILSRLKAKYQTIKEKEEP